MEEESKLEKDVKEAKPKIDPSTSPYTEHNLDAAKKLRVRYSKRQRGYLDTDGVKVLDKYGQPLG